MPESEEIKASPRRQCPGCGAAAPILHDQLKDRVFDAPGVWRLRECLRCELVWLDPLPDASELHRFYSRYFTHAPTRRRDLSLWRSFQLSYLRRYGYDVGSRRLAALAGLVPGVDLLAGGYVNWLPSGEGKRLLDVGCGSGDFLRRMRALGWDVMGLEPDPVAAHLGRLRYGLEIRAGGLEDFPEASFDAVTAHHVIEHVPDPAAFVRTAGSLLRPGGRLVLVTPNSGSLGRRLFGASWVHWDPPRHLRILRRGSLLSMVRAAGLTPVRVHTTARKARFVWSASRSIARTQPPRANVDGAMGLGLVAAVLFQVFEHVWGLLAPDAGEELVVLATAGGEPLPKGV